MGIYKYRRLILILLIIFIAMCSGIASAALNTQSKKIIRSASEYDYPPFALVLENGEPDGFSVDLLKAVCKEIGLELNIKVGPWHEIKQDLKVGSIDVLPLVSYSKERDAVYDFTVPYLRMRGTIFVRQGENDIHSVQDLKGKEVIVMQGDTAHECALSQNLTDKIIVTETFEEAMKLLSKGKHDAVFIQQLVGWQLIKRLGLTNIKDVSKSIDADIAIPPEQLRGFEQKFCFAVREGDSELLSLLNEGLSIAVVDGTYDKLYQKWFGAILPEAELSVEEKIKLSLYTVIPSLLLFSIISLVLLKKKVRDKTMHLVKEIEKRKTAEEILHNSNERYQTLVNNCGEGLIVVQDRILKYVNPEYCNMSGFEEKDFLGKQLLDFVDPAYHEMVTTNYTRCMAGEALDSYQIQFLCADGSIQWHEISGARIEWEKRHASLLFVQDVTEKKKFIEKIMESKKEAEDANKSKSIFLANMSHELRTPLNGIMGMHQLLQATPLNDEQVEYVNIAIQSSERLTRLLADILDLSRVEAESLEIGIKPFSLNELINQVTSLFQPSSKQSGVSLNATIDPALDFLVIGDEFRLQQILNNLVGNAFKFTNQGSIDIKISLLSSSGSENSQVQITVSDTGIGIPSDKIDYIFNPFTQAEGDYSRKYQGAGLGLAIVDKLVALMGGSLTLESKEGVGTTVTLEFTFEKGGELGKSEELPHASNTCSFSECKVLVVEDDEVNSFSIAKQVEKMGLSVKTASNGKECLESLKHARFEVILMDIQMPIMDGLEATRTIRLNEINSGNERATIIALTAFAMAGDKEKFINAGMDDYLEKPVSHEALQSVLSKYLRTEA